MKKRKINPAKQNPKIIYFYDKKNEDDTIKRAIIIYKTVKIKKILNISGLNPLLKDILVTIVNNIAIIRKAKLAAINGVLVTCFTSKLFA